MDGIMRTLFIIVAFLGLLLTGPGTYEFRDVNEENTRIATFGQTQYQAVYGHNVHSTYKLIWTSDNTVELETISTVIVFAGAVLAGIGLIAAIKFPKDVKLPALPEKPALS
jgi:hypothetical protein